MELPSSWGLSTVKRDDGKLDVIGKADNGEAYRVRTTDHAEITETDIQELRDADRESYRDREHGCYEAVERLMAPGKQRRASEETALFDDLTEASGPVVHAGLERKGLTVGSSRRYRQNYDSVFGGN